MDITSRPDYHGLAAQSKVDMSPPRGRLRRWFVRLTAGFFLLLVMLVVLGPWLISTGPGTAIVVSFINGKIDGDLKIDDLSLSWFGGQSVGGIHFINNEQGIDATVKQIGAADIGLFDLATGSRSLGEVRLIDTAVHYVQPQKTDEEQVPEPDKPEGDKPLSLPPGFSGRLVLENFTVTYEANELEQVRLTLPKGTADVPNLREINLDFDASVKQGLQSGRLLLVGDVLNLFDPDGQLQPKLAAFKLRGGLEGISTQALGSMLERFGIDSDQPGRFAAVMGAGDFSANADISGVIDELLAEIKVKAPHIDVQLKTEREGSTLIASPDSKVTLDLTPEAFASLMPKSKLSLHETTRFELASLQMRLPTVEDKPDLESASFAMQLKGGANFALKVQAGEVIGIDRLSIVGGSNSIAKELKFSLSATMSAVDKSGKVLREPIRADLVVMRPLDGNKEVVLQSDSLPITLADALLSRNGDLTSILGPMVQQALVSLSVEGAQPRSVSLQLNWDAQANQPLPGAAASLKPVAFDINDQNMLRVRGGQDIELYARVSEAFGNRWMGQLHPILFDARSGDKPVVVKVKGDSFAFPLSDPQMKGANVTADIDLGSIQFGQDSLLSKLLVWTNLPTQQAIFDPVQVSLTDGQLGYDKLALAVGNVRLNLDGKLDLVAGNIVQMNTRVPGSSLLKIFHDLEGVIKPEDSLNIPMTGSIRHPKFDSSLIAKEVAKLAAEGLLNKQKDKLLDRLREQAGDVLPKPKPKPAPEPGPQTTPPTDPKTTPSPEPQPEPAPQPQPQEKPLEEQLKEKALDTALDLLFGKRRGQPTQTGDKQEQP